MAWDKGQSKSVAGGDWAVFTEAVTLNTAATDQSTSVIDFIPYGKDFYVIATTSVTLATPCPVDIDMCDDSAGTFFALATTGITVAKTAGTLTDLIDNSAKGQAPYYKLRIDKPAAAKTATGGTVTFKVLVPPAYGVVY